MALLTLPWRDLRSILALLLQMLIAAPHVRKVDDDVCYYNSDRLSPRAQVLCSGWRKAFLPLGTPFLCGGDLPRLEYHTLLMQ